VKWRLPVADLSGERILVLGASGWLGKTFLNILGDVDPESVHAVGSKSDTLIVNNRSWRLAEPDDQEIRRFAPTVIANFAFLTREREAQMGAAAYLAVNQVLSERFIASVALPTVKKAITISSGAAITQPDSTYGKLKAAEELAATKAISRGQTLVIGRAYSLSGPFVRRPSDYAFSDFILQAAQGAVHVTAACPVYRRYVSAHDFLGVLLQCAIQDRCETIESGGELVEMGDLAARVVAEINPYASLTRAAQTSSEVQIYASNDSTWQSALEATGMRALDLRGQIVDAAAGILPAGQIRLT